jgi:L-iditol 2-dehydrogenase
LLACFIIQPGKIELREINTPKPFHGEILVKIKAALTCGTDLKAYKRGHPVIPMPGVFGHEFSGIVAGVGRGVRRFKEGDEIMSVHSAPCLKCAFCKKKASNLCEKIMETKILGAFAEYMVLPSHILKQNVFHKPKNITFEEAAFLEPLSCVVHGIESLNIQKNNNTLVIGAGPIGLLHLLLLKQKGARVTITDKHRKKLNVARKLGADFVINSKITDSPSPTPLPSREGSLSGHTWLRNEIISDRVSSSLFKEYIPSPLVGEGKGEGDIKLNKFTNNIGFDYVFECTGMPEVWESSINYVRRGGTVILFGGCKSGTKVTYDAGRLHYNEITLRCVFHYTPSDVQKAYDLLRTKKLKVSKLISERYSLKNIQKAFDKLSKGEGIKYAIIP